MITYTYIHTNANVSIYRCPRGYHTNCIPPGSRYSSASACLLCPDHPHDRMPDSDHHLKSGAGTGTDAGEGAAFTDLWDQMVLPDRYPRADVPGDNHFRLPIHLQLEVQAQPAVFKIINRLEYDALPLREKSVPLKYPDEECECKKEQGGCGFSCLNRVSKVECCEAPKPNGSSICHCGPDCGNRLFQDKIYSKVTRFQEYAMGWGLRTAEAVDCGDLVIEYIGEVIDEMQMQKRMGDQRKFTPNDHNFYIMQLDTGLYVDGKHRGSESRFINHSCAPNCELQPWVVKGRMRIGIFAIKDIEEGEALSYDYQFDTNEDDIFQCYCGAPTCRGTMAPKKKMNKASLSRAERTKLLVDGRKKDKESQSRKTTSEEEKSRSYTGKMLPGDTINEIRSGPVRASFALARAKMVFLPRNTKVTLDMVQRRKKEWARAEKLNCSISKVSSISSVRGSSSISIASSSSQ